MQSSEPGSEQRAAPPERPPLTPEFLRERAEYERYRRQRETIERRSMVRGLILLAVVVLLGSILRAGLARVFVHGWWRSCADGGSYSVEVQGPATSEMLRGRRT
jgi:hypothetical protein